MASSQMTLQKITKKYKNLPKITTPPVITLEAYGENRP
jgi:hypothetical protein